MTPRGAESPLWEGNAGLTLHQAVTQPRQLWPGERRADGGTGAADPSDRGRAGVAVASLSATPRAHLTARLLALLGEDQGQRSPAHAVLGASVSIRVRTRRPHTARVSLPAAAPAVRVSAGEGGRDYARCRQGAQRRGPWNPLADSCGCSPFCILGSEPPQGRGVESIAG